MVFHLRRPGENGLWAVGLLVLIGEREDESPVVVLSSLALGYFLGKPGWGVLQFAIALNRILFVVIVYSLT